MAKKTTSTPEEVKVPKQGMRFCPQCNHQQGVRIPECTECKYKFPAKTAPTVNVSQPPQHLQAAMQFVAVTGGFAAARKALDDSEAFLRQVEAWKDKVGKIPANAT
jgi:hypothetical protein